MVQENTHNEAEIRRFLLSEMPEDERNAFEARFVTDESLFEQINVSEDELIESYVRGTLSPAETIIFEREFLATESRRRRVAFTRTMLDKINKENEFAAAKKTEAVREVHPSVWNLIADFFKTPKFALGIAFALLILAFGSWFLVFKSSSNQIEIAKQISPTPTAEIIEPVTNQNAATNQNSSSLSITNTTGNALSNKTDLPNANRAAPNVNANTNKPKKSSVETAPILALFAGTVRSEGKTPELNFPKNASGANIQLNLESIDYKSYSIEIVDPDGNSIFTNNNLKARGSKINFFVPVGKLPVGDYIVKLSARNSKNENESVADYSFRVKRQ